MNFAVCRVLGLIYFHGDVFVLLAWGARIGLFYAMQGIVSLFMPAIMGLLPPTDGCLLKNYMALLIHFMAAVFMVAAGVVWLRGW